MERISLNGNLNINRTMDLSRKRKDDMNYGKIQNDN